MPQLVKGGKHVFGWCRIGPGGGIVLPPEAVKEYRLEEAKRLILLPGSRTSGGFLLGSFRVLADSPLGRLTQLVSRMSDFSTGEGELLPDGEPLCCWARLRRGGIVLPPQTRRAFSVIDSRRLLAVRGSGLALTLIARGPIFREAEKHPELEVYPAGLRWPPR